MAMGSSRWLFLFSSILIQLVVLTIAQPNFTAQYCSNIGNYTSGSTYQTNLNSLLSLLSSNNEIDYGFYNFSVGQSPNEVYAIALCRGDVALDDCRSCVSNATQKILQVCPNQKEAIGWYGYCMLRYSNKSIFGVVEELPAFYLWNKNNASDVNQFNQALETMLNDLQSRAASGDSLRKFASGNTSANFQTIYALVQCTPDLSDQQCTGCLNSAIGDIPNVFPGKQGGQVKKPSCNLRFESNAPFFAQTPDTNPPPSTTPPPPSRGKKNNTSRTVIIIVVPIVGVVILIICICIFLRTRRRKTREKVETVDDISSVESLQFDFGTIRAATDNFSDANKLGQGGFGAVYKGTLNNGQDVAVKRLSMDSGQGDLEFKNEVLLVAKLQHRNLVRLQGFCLEGNERLLIYEFVPNTSLDHFIFDSVKRLHLDWERRYKIIGGTARGLLYLHEDSRLRIIHRDLKASNILLDAEMNAKISDFGMAKLFARDETQGNTSRIVGTYGYMAPEYAMHGQFSIKSDVYSFGVLLLEILSGQKNSCFRNGENVEDLLSCAWKFWREGRSLDLIDPILRASSRTEMLRCIHIGLLCVQENVADRPTMASVVLMLSSYSLTLPVPSQPAFFMHSTIESDMSSSLGYNLRATESNQSKDEIIPLSANDVSITELYPR